MYRLAEADIGCSLAEAAETDTYMSYLSTAAQTPNRCEQEANGREIRAEQR